MIFVLLYKKSVFSIFQFVSLMIVLIAIIPIFLKEIACYRISKNKDDKLFLELVTIANIPGYWLSCKYRLVVEKLRVKHFVEVIPEYMLSFEIALFIFFAVFKIISGYMRTNQNLLTDEAATFICLIVPLVAFKYLGLFFSLTSRKAIVYCNFKRRLKSEQWPRDYIKKKMKTVESRKERRSEVKELMKEIESERKIATIIACILAMVLLLIWHKENEFASLFVEEMVGIITIMGLIRELKNKIMVE